MSASDYYQKQHDKGLRTLATILKRVRDGTFWIVSVNLNKSIGDKGGWRLVIHLRERE